VQNLWENLANTVWITQEQMSQLFGISQPVIASHIKM
jgi:hypothetical protein